MTVGSFIFLDNAAARREADIPREASLVRFARWLSGGAAAN